jgi:hypothetical protein
VSQDGMRVHAFKYASLTCFFAGALCYHVQEDSHTCMHACMHARSHLHTQDCFAYFVLVVEDAHAVEVVFIAREAEGLRAVVSEPALQGKCWAAGLLGGIELGL